MFGQLWLSNSLQRLSVVTVGQSSVSDGWLLCLTVNLSAVTNRDDCQILMSCTGSPLSVTAYTSWRRAVCLKSHYFHFTKSDLPWLMVAVWSSLVSPLVSLSVFSFLVGLLSWLTFSKKKISQTVLLPILPLPQVEFSGVCLLSIHSSPGPAALFERLTTISWC